MCLNKRQKPPVGGLFESTLLVTEKDMGGNQGERDVWDPRVGARGMEGAGGPGSGRGQRWDDEAGLSGFH